MNTKRFIPVALVAAAGLTIAACGGSSGTPSSTPTSPPATSAPASPTDQFVADLASLNDPVINAASASLIIGLGNGACTDLANDGGQLGPVLTDAASVVQDGNTGLSYTEIGEVVGVAVKDLCPQYKSTVEQQLASGSYTTS